MGDERPPRAPARPYYTVVCAVCRRSTDVPFSGVMSDLNRVKEAHWYCEKYPDADPSVPITWPAEKI